VVLAAMDNVFASTVEQHEHFILHRISGGDFFIGRNIVAKAINHLRFQLLHDVFRFKVSYKIKEIIDAYKIDIVEIPEYGNEGKLWLMQKTIPTVLRFHGPSSLDRFIGTLNPISKKQFEEIASFDLADAHSFVSQALRDVIYSSPYYEKHYEKLSIIIHNGVNNSANIDVDTIVENKPFRIVGAGSIGAIKGWDRLILACELLNRHEKKVTLHLYGRMADLEKFIQDIKNKNYSVQKWLYIYGQIERDELMTQYASADICCFPSWFEPCSLTVLEAMSQGALVLASNLGGSPEFINEGLNGFLIDPVADIKTLANKIEHLLALNYSEKLKIRQNAYYSTQANLSFSTFLDKTLELYESVLEETQGLR